MAFIQVRRWSGHAAIEAVQNESSSGEGAFETPRAGAAVGSGGRDSNQALAQLSQLRAIFGIFGLIFVVKSCVSVVEL